ncbi:MAG: AAA family ATPase [Candidatus Thorarchaeota archaeon]
MSKSEIYSKKELILMIGPTMSGKSYYINNHLIRNYQIISEGHIASAMQYENVPKDEDFKYAIMSVIARAHMLRGLPIVVDESNLTIESLFIWKRYAFEYKYKIKGIVLDTPLKICLERLESSLKHENLVEGIIKNLKSEYERFKEIKLILNMKYQNVIDDFEVVSYEDGGN